MKSVISKALVLGSIFAANYASAGVAVPPRVQMSCVDYRGVRGYITQYDTQNVSISNSVGGSFSGIGYIDNSGQGTIRIPANGSTWTFYYSRTGLTLQIIQPGRRTTYGSCSLAAYR